MQPDKDIQSKNTQTDREHSAQTVPVHRIDESPADVSKTPQGNWPLTFKAGQTVTKKLNVKDVERLNTICGKMGDLMVTDKGTGLQRRPNKSEVFAYAIKVAAGEAPTLQKPVPTQETVENLPKRRLRLGVNFFD